MHRKKRRLRAFHRMGRLDRGHCRHRCHRRCYGHCRRRRHVRRCVACPDRFHQESEEKGEGEEDEKDEQDEEVEPSHRLAQVAWIRLYEKAILVGKVDSRLPIASSSYLDVRLECGKDGGASK